MRNTPGSACSEFVQGGIADCQGLASRDIGGSCNLLRNAGPHEQATWSNAQFFSQIVSGLTNLADIRKLELIDFYINNKKLSFSVMKYQIHTLAADVMLPAKKYQARLDYLRATFENACEVNFMHMHFLSLLLIGA